ncbi:hypothetical protein [Acetanaerobacterium elongatum]|uniref:Uncharacterized protein n=1 Tax=Acetanaerobacterium elongatum TaxID=258515 RepID=A0A1G9X1H5_9FIRM|nr:hypothetical protein [Acetanaerobacterium elongatum]SDM90548.1 hypothetical protein SAMN05192585_10760 [Acetanaerobacterium elongatum]
MKGNPVKKNNASHRHAPEEPACSGTNLYQRQKPQGKTLPILSNSDVEFSKEFEADNQ